MDTETPVSLDTLGREHAALVELFQLHQEALITRRWGRAAQLLREYRQRLTVHIGVEEEWLLPALPDTARWNRDVYQAEHRKLEQLLEALAAQFSAARRHGVKPALIIRLIEDERVVKHLMEHHHEREEKALFAEVGRRFHRRHYSA
ncbi:MAG TPA: hemerythrin domain-containing protein [Gammaproteobacteria bacterium]|jgi:hemerythrin-like domain-containing protein|nr:hemerythrin domain-containing protein [Gammaproteobacteria bacterium]